MTPIFLLSDGYIANGAEPWRFPQSKDLVDIDVRFLKDRKEDDPVYLPYERDEKLVRSWAIPGTKGLEHRVGGLEKDQKTGNVSYDPENHHQMVKIRAAKVDKIADYNPLQELESGSENSELIVVGWGSTFGAIKTAVRDLASEGVDVAHTQIKYIQPMPKNLGKLLSNYDKILVPEMNNGRLIKFIRDRYLLDAKPLNKIKGMPFEAQEIKSAILKMLNL